MQNKKLQFLSLIIILYLVHFFGRFFGLYNYFIVAGIINLFLTYYLLRVNQFKKIGLLLIFFPLALSSIVVFLALFNSVPLPGIIGYFIYLTSSIFGILFYNINKKVFLAIYAIIFLISIFQYQNMFNFYYSYIEKNSRVGLLLPKIEIFDNKNNSQILNNNGKILVIDLWSNTCGNCIKDFPKFEKLKNEFANDNSVDFISINIYNKRSDIVESEKYLKKYTFKKYFTDRSVYKKLDFNSIPNYMLVGKDGKIKYFGNLNMETHETYNNIYKLIENEK